MYEWTNILLSNHNKHTAFLQAQTTVSESTESECAAAETKT